MVLRLSKPPMYRMVRIDRQSPFDEERRRPVHTGRFRLQRLSQHCVSKSLQHLLRSILILS